MEVCLGTASRKGKILVLQVLCFREGILFSAGSKCGVQTCLAAGAKYLVQNGSWGWVRTALKKTKPVFYTTFAFSH